jgi:CheY-like chemotaxis protein
MRASRKSSMSDKRAKILVIDDERWVVEGLADLLEGSFEVLTAMDGTEALDMLKLHRDLAVIISDLHMPNMDGATFQAFQKSAAAGRADSSDG